MRSNKTIDDAHKRHIDANMQKIYKAGDGDASNSGDDGVGDNSSIILGNPTTNHYYPEKPKGLGTLAKLALGTGLLTTVFGAGVGVPLLLDALAAKPEHTVSVETKTETETMDWRLGKPIVE